jgi:hypothetical protein
MPIVRDTIQKDGQQVEIYIEVEEAAGAGDDFLDNSHRVINTAREMFASGMNLIQTCAEQVWETIERVEQNMRPSECEVQLSIKLDTQVGAILVNTGAEAQLQVTLKWSQPTKTAG